MAKKVDIFRYQPQRYTPVAFIVTHNHKKSKEIRIFSEKTLFPQETYFATVSTRLMEHESCQTAKKQKNGKMCRLFLKNSKFSLF